MSCYVVNHHLLYGRRCRRRRHNGINNNNSNGKWVKVWQCTQWVKTLW